MKSHFLLLFLFLSLFQSNDLQCMNYKQKLTISAIILAGISVVFFTVYNKENSRQVDEVQDYNAKQDNKAIEEIFKENWYFLTGRKSQITENSVKEYFKPGKTKITKVIRNDIHQTVAFIVYGPELTYGGFIYLIGVKQDSQRKN